MDDPDLGGAKFWWALSKTTIYSFMVLISCYTFIIGFEAIYKWHKTRAITHHISDGYVLSHDGFSYQYLQSTGTWATIKILPTNH